MAQATLALFAASVFAACFRSSCIALSLDSLQSIAANVSGHAGSDANGTAIGMQEPAGAQIAPFGKEDTA
eukprot:CAMPEP_0179252980 /NCGR_PEP_ID=MMETSP0797-20121207/22489_1 /TAXON_ID=47934 /ORGANISM="Dinophysis acuminata, Strain DAEP01" /LENGTH=69 /DNA_ID=CAMNT_0020960817 /DNA_START=61 /DNA_END=267 /DNA_ORIENTATION=+